MPIKKRTMVAGAMAAAAAIGLAGVGSVGLVSAATNNNADANTSIVDKIASKFNLNKSDVQAVFDEDRSEHEADMQAHQKERLAQAVTNGKLTQDQADHITQAMQDIQSLRDGKRPDELDQSTKDQIKSKMEALQTWAQQNNIAMSLVGPGRGHGGFGGPGARDGAADPGSSSDTSATTN